MRFIQFSAIVIYLLCLLIGAFKERRIVRKSLALEIKDTKALLRAGKWIWFKIGFYPRKANLSLYLVLDIRQYADTLQKLGKHKTGAGCLYVNKLGDIDIKVLEELINVAAKMK